MKKRVIILVLSFLILLLLANWVFALSRLEEARASLPSAPSMGQAVQVVAEIDSGSCDDNARNANETDVDCGGNCDACSAGKACMLDTDCQTGYCYRYNCAVRPDIIPDSPQQGVQSGLDSPQNSESLSKEQIELYSKKEFNPWLKFSVFINFLLIITLGIFIFKDSIHFRIPSLKNKIPKEPEHAQRSTSTALSEYIDECRSQGQTDDDIRQSLIGQGWDVEHVDSELDFFTNL